MVAPRQAPHERGQSGADIATETQNCEELNSTRGLRRDPGASSGEAPALLPACGAPLYALAPIRVPSAHAPHETTVRAILEALRQ